jgi:alkylation response protein AidB-like acyl-CoA dehydrogenase
VAGESIGDRGSLMKLHWSEAHQRFAALALELLEQAPPGASPEVQAARARFQRIYLSARAETIYAGTTEIQLGIIGDRILKLPRGADTLPRRRSATASSLRGNRSPPVAACAGLARGRARQLAATACSAYWRRKPRAGFFLAFATPVMDAAGAGLLNYPLAETLLLGAAFGATPFGPAIVLGEKIATIAWAGRAAVAGGKLSGTVGRAPLADEADLLLVETDIGAALVPLDAPGVTIQPAFGLELETPEHEISLTQVAPVALLDTATFAALREDALPLWAAAIGGAAERCLALALEHVSTREQFGRTLVSFQALRHALARQKLAVEHVRAALERHAALTAREADEARVAGRAAYAAATRFGIGAISARCNLWRMASPGGGDPPSPPRSIWRRRA